VKKRPVFAAFSKDEHEAIAAAFVHGATVKDICEMTGLAETAVIAVLKKRMPKKKKRKGDAGR
jgi:hypothetical protein